MNKLSDTTIAKIHAYRAMNYSQSEIADKLDLSINPVTKYLNNTKKRAQCSENPLEIYGELNEQLLDVRVEVKA